MNKNKKKDLHQFVSVTFGNVRIFRRYCVNIYFIFSPPPLYDSHTVIVLRPIQSAAVKCRPEPLTDAQEAKHKQISVDVNSQGACTGSGAPQAGGGWDWQVLLKLSTGSCGQTQRRSSPRCGETVPYFSRQERWHLQH